MKAREGIIKIESITTSSSEPEFKFKPEELPIFRYNVVKTSEQLNNLLDKLQLELIIPTLSDITISTETKAKKIPLYYYTDRDKLDLFKDTLEGKSEKTSRDTIYKVLALRKKDTYEIIGCIHYDTSGKINSLVILKEHQNQNLGSLLLASVIERNKISSFYLNSSPEALPMYFKLGFRPDINQYKMREQRHGEEYISDEKLATLEDLDSKWYDLTLQERIDFENSLAYNYLILDFLGAETTLDKAMEAKSIYNARINQLINSKKRANEQESDVQSKPTKLAKMSFFTQTSQSENPEIVTKIINLTQ